MKKSLLAMSALLISGMASAQQCYYVTEFPLNPTSVSNEGLVVGGSGDSTPFILWNPFTDYAYVIGGKSAGMDGAAGPARISADGKTVIGSNWSDEIEVPTTWERAQYEKFPFAFKSYIRGNEYNLFVGGVGQDENGVTRTYVLKSANNGKSWTASYDLNFPKNVPEGSVSCMSAMNTMKYYIGTDNGKLYWSSGNQTWKLVDVRAEDDTRAVKSYTAMDFILTNWSDKDAVSSGAIGFVADDDTYGVWYTENNGDDFHQSSGVAGIPAYITHINEVFYMVTKNGHIQKSTDYCATWEDCYSAEGIEFRKVVFGDANNGIAIADRLVLLTSDGGKTWKVAVVENGDVSPFSDDTSVSEWHDVVWADGKIAIVGDKARLYISDDSGKTFKRHLVDGADKDNFRIVMFDRSVFNIVAENGVFFRKTLQPTVEGYVPSVYDVENDTWTQMASFGQVTDRQAGSTWGISPDGKYAAGIANIFDPEVNKVCGYAGIWGENGVTSLGTMFPGSPTRANRVNYDGSVVVGFQDKMGPWMASVWRRQDDGSYKQKLMFKDPEMKPEDVNFNNFNDITAKCLGNILAVSQNGKWIGGTGGSWYALDNAWIWSEEKGLEDLGVDGSTVEVAEDGSMAVGRNTGGMGTWLWTREGGVKELNQYVTEQGGDLQDTAITGFYAMSPNGRFLVGYSYDNEMNPCGYMIDLKPETGNIEQMESNQVKASVYPNPVVSELHVDLPYDSDTVQTTITLYGMQGSAVRRINNCRQSNVMNVDGLAAGIYMLDVHSGNTHKVFKVVVK